MIIAPLPANEADRIAALKAYQILDTRSEAGFDALTHLASMICNTSISLVSLIDHDRQWFKSNQGLPQASQTPRDIAFCTHAILGDQLLEVNDATLDQRFHDNPLVTADPNIRFYAGMPLINDAGFALGTLCVIDSQPKTLNDFQRQALASLAQAVVSLIDAKKGSYRLLQIIEHAPYGALIISDQQIITSVNPPLMQMLGYRPDELVGLTIDQLVTPLSNTKTLAAVLAPEARTQLQRQHTQNAAQYILSQQGRLIAIESYRSDIGDGFYALMIIDVSQRMAIAERVIKSRDDLQKIIDQVPALIGYWDHELHNHFGNKTYLEWFGYSPGEMKGKHLREVVGETLFKLNQPYIQGALSGQPQMFERTITDPQGRQRNTLASFVPDIEDGEVKGFFAFLNDITPLKTAEKARFEAEAQLQAVFDAAIGQSIIATDLDGTIKIFSRGAELMLGYAASELVHLHTPMRFLDRGEVVARQRELMSELGHHVDGIDILMHRVRAGGLERREWTYCRKDGSRLWVDMVVSGIRGPSGELVGFLGLAHDITEQKSYQGSLAAAAEAAEAASQAKSAFVANMSHEIRTPMNAVMGMTQLLANMPLATEQRKYVDMIRAAGESLLFIIDDILDFSKIEAGKLDIEHKAFDLENIIRDVSSIMMVHAQDKPIEMIVDLDPAIPSQLVGDGMRLKQVLTNLATNAAKFTHRGVITIRISLIQQTAQQASLHFELQDTGIGLRPEQQSKLFTPFTQADSTTTRRYGGTGLGLVICQHLIGLMKGRLGLQSEFGVGSRFWFDLEFGLPTADASALEPTSASSVLGLPIQHVLLAEDNDDSRRVLSRIMTGWGWRVDSVATGRQMVERYQQQSMQPYDLVIADISTLVDDTVANPLYLPKMFKATPVLITLNAFERQLLTRKIYQDWIKAMVVKPMTPSSLIEAIIDARRQRLPDLAMQASPAEERVATPIQPSTINGLRILVVEDNAFNQIVAQGLLESSGARVEIASNGQAAVDILRSRHSAFDVVLMDVQMPVMDGFQATQYIRSQMGLDIPIIAMSAGVLLAEREQCTAVGMNDFIAKPIDVSLMLAVIARNMSRTGAVVLPAVTPVAKLATFDIDDLAVFYRNSSAGIGPLCELLERAALRSRGIADQLHTLWQRGDSAAMMKLLHSARGSYGSMGAKQFAHLADILEQCLASGEPTGVDEQLAVLATELHAYQYEMGEWLAIQHASIASTPDDSIDVSLDAFKASLAAQSMQAYDLYPHVKKTLLKHDSATDLTRVDHFMANLQFDQVLAWLAARE
jgi:PAS domain S-box-containing protein